MNRCDYLDPGLAWTGVKETGYGASLSSLGYGPLTRPKSLKVSRLRSLGALATAAAVFTGFAATLAGARRKSAPRCVSMSE